MHAEWIVMYAKQIVMHTRRMVMHPNSFSMHAKWRFSARTAFHRFTVIDPSSTGMYRKRLFQIMCTNPCIPRSTNSPKLVSQKKFSFSSKRNS